jgi:hypothetical protein
MQTEASESSISAGALAVEIAPEAVGPQLEVSVTGIAMSGEIGEFLGTVRNWLSRFGTQPSATNLPKHFRSADSRVLIADHWCWPK